MATVETLPGEPTLDGVDPNWREEFKQQWLQVALAEKAFMLDKWQKQEARVKAIADMAATGKPYQPPDESEMGVSIGNKNYYSAPTTTDTQQTQQTASVIPQTVKQGIRGFSKAALIATALASGGLGAGAVAAIPTLLAWFSKPPVATPAEAGARVRVFWNDVELQPNQPLSTTVNEPTKPP